MNACGYQNKELTIGNPLNSTHLDELVDSVLTTARLLNNDKYISSPKSAVIDIHRSLLQSFKLFENWPLYYYEALERLQTEGNRGEKKGILRFGQFYQAVFGKESKHNNQNLNVLREGFESYLKSVWVDGNVGLLKHIDDNNIRYVTLNKASEILHKTEETIKKLLENKILKGVIKQYNSTNLYLVEKNSIEEYKKLEKDSFIKVRKSYNELENFITKIDLERFLLISETTIKELVLAGVFNPVSGPEIDGNHIRVYKNEELYNFFSILNSKVKKDLITNDKDLVSFHEARKLINCHFSDFINYVLNNEITVIKINNQDEEESIKHYYFLKVEVLNKIKQEINGLNILELSSILKVSKASITNWIRNGFFTFELKRGKKVIRYTDVELFKQKYIPLTHIPIFNKNDSNAVIKLRNQGILPVSGFSQDGGIGYLYLKKEIEKIFGSNIDW